MSKNKVNVLGYAVVNEMIKKLFLEKMYIFTRCFQELFMGQMDAPSSC